MNFSYIKHSLISTGSRQLPKLNPLCGVVAPCCGVIYNKAPQLHATLSELLDYLHKYILAL